jgi:predicted RNase H-like HicB family nuclease
MMTRGKPMKLTAVFEKVRGGYIGFVEELPGANTQGRTLRETRENLKEAVALVLEANRMLAEESVGKKKVIRESFELDAR